MAVKASCQTSKDLESKDMGLITRGLRVAVVLLPLLGVTWVFGLLAVNDRILAFHYLFAIFNCFQGIFILLAHIVFNKRMRKDLKNVWLRCRGVKVPEDDLNCTRTSLSRSALAYHHDSSLEGGLNRMNVGISTTSTTSRSTSKTSSGGLYRADGYIRSNGSTSTSGNIPSIHDYPPHSGIPPYGYDSSMFHDKRLDDPDTGISKRRKRRDSDSDSELSALENQNDIELASSHSSDEDDDDQYGPRWDQLKKPIGYAPPPPYAVSNTQRKGWPGELSTTTMSDSEIRSPNQINIQDKYKSSLEKIISESNSRRGSQDQLSPPERTDSLPRPDLPPKPDYTGTNKKDSPNMNGLGRRSPKSPNNRMAVHVLTHNGSISSESDSHETSV